ncbi:hypothetical protein BKA81DRAFT_64161 [Phyllosticta paracitricarpa]
MSSAIGPNRYKYFRWTPKTAWYSIAYAIVFPSVVGYIAYATEVSRLDGLDMWIQVEGGRETRPSHWKVSERHNI